MKNLLIAVLFALVFAACSSSPSKDGDTVASADGSDTKTKRVCETVRTNETGARMKRVCKEVVVKED